MVDRLTWSGVELGVRGRIMGSDYRLGYPAAVAIAGVVSLSVLSCAFTQPSGRLVTSNNAIKLGVLSSFSGTGASTGTLNGVEMALARINTAGGVLGRPLEPVVADDQSNKAGAVQVSEKLLSAGVVAVVGPNSSSITREVILSQAAVKGIVFISPSATAPGLTDPAQVNTNGYFFRTVPHDALQGKVLASRAFKKGYRNLAVIHVNSAYGNGLAQVLKTDFEANPGMRATLIPYPESADPASSYNEYVKQALALKPDAIVLVGYAGEGSGIINEWLLGRADRTTPWLFADGLQSQSLVNNVRDPRVLEGQEGTAPAIDREFIQEFSARYDRQPTTGAAGAFDATMLLALAIEAAKSTERRDIQTKLRAVSGPEGTRIRPNQIAEGLRLARAGESVNYDGFAGNIDFDERGDVTSGNYQIWTIKDGVVTRTGEIITF